MIGAAGAWAGGISGLVAGAIPIERNGAGDASGGRATDCDWYVGAAGGAGGTTGDATGAGDTGRATGIASVGADGRATGGGFGIAGGAGTAVSAPRRVAEVLASFAGSSLDFGERSHMIDLSLGGWCLPLSVHIGQVRAVLEISELTTRTFKGPDVVPTSG